MDINKPEFLIKAEKKLKKIWDLLRDVQVVRFTLSMRLYRDDVSEPKTFSIQGERSTDGSWNTSLPRDQNSGALQSPDILKGKLAIIEKHVREYIAENELDDDWKEVEASLKKALESGLSVEDLEVRCEVLALDVYGNHARFYAPMVATAYAINGTEALVKNDLNHASHCVERGLYWSNSDMFIPNPNDRFEERARAGGKGKALGHEPVKEKVAELLMKLAPEEGWKSTPTAIKAVANKLTESHSDFVEACGLITDNLPRTTARWIEAEPERFPHRINKKK